MFYYTGNIDENGKRHILSLGLSPLEREYPYEIVGMCELGGFIDGIKMAVGIDTHSPMLISFDANMFSEVQPPQSISIDEIISVEA